MYLPRSYAEHDVDRLHDFVQMNPFGALVTASADGMFATHLPLLLDRTRGERGTLEGHLARANEHHRRATDQEALVIFNGPDAYVTPAWYPAKQQHGKVVPTWNYVAVHVYGTLAFVDDPAFLHRHLAALTAEHEAHREQPWGVEDAPPEFIAAQQRAIVGVELTITRIEGKWKMSQNRDDADIDGVVAGLSASPRAGDRTVAEIVQARRPARR